MQTSEIFAPPKETEAHPYVLAYVNGMFCCCIIGGVAGIIVGLILKNI